MNELNKKEVDYYGEISTAILNIIIANFGKTEKYDFKILLGEISSALRTLIANGYKAGGNLFSYSKNVHRLHLDISLLIENKNNGKFEIIIFEVKKTKKLGLTELSQLIGYCLVSKCEFGILINVDNSISQEFSIILDSDKDLTRIDRIIDEKKMIHEFGIMIWNSKTHQVEYTGNGAIKTIPKLVEKIKNNID